ncbi:MAG: iron uptake transporter permease EfeU [Corynebacterium sp.]|nr:iron uptake transporter permease EfeU [Corynebacterium sp.]
MFVANFLIALREGLEAALVVSVLVAYLVKVNRKDVLPALWLGVAIAAIIPLAAGAWMTFGPYTLSFGAQETIGGGLSLLAAAMVTWMILWMAAHGAAMSHQLTGQAETALKAGGWALVWLAIVSVGREGIETAVFVWATVKASATGGVVAPALGVMVGLIVAIGLGYLIYTGAVHLNLSLFFTVTGLFLVLVAAGIFTYGIGDLQEASLIPGWGVWAYDLSPWLAAHSNAWWFVLAEAMFNFTITPTHLQVIGWMAYVVIVGALFLYYSARAKRQLREQRAQREDTTVSHRPVALERTL